MYLLKQIAEMKNLQKELAAGNFVELTNGEFDFTIKLVFNKKEALGTFRVEMDGVLISFTKNWTELQKTVKELISEFDLVPNK